MAISYPRTDLFTSRGFTQASFDLLQRQESSRTAGGDAIGKDLGPGLWVGEWTTVPSAFDDAVTYEAMLRSLDGVIGTFNAYDLRRPYPKANPSGSFTDSGAIASVQSAKALTLKSLPAGFVISVGDYFHFDYGSNPTNRALHQAMEAVTADGSGDTTSFEVRPHIRTGAVADIAVKFKLPSARFRLEPRGVTPSMQGGLFGSVTFRAVQAVE